ncbi:SWI/SNF complex subunit SWI3D [Senna tora]|uniref:SWI/SNF complex subunit SWI3D n=1 Tax=Senna tora TaxID=362788 RepID=A0A834XB83_9FABA|nr:SWI/SNF complex subunit SWI3D [Senna tora]
MEEKPAVQPPSNADSPASEPTTSRRRAGGLKRKANALGASNSSPTPSKRVTREKALPPHTPPSHNGPLTRARQIPSSLAAASASTAGGGGSAAAAVKYSEHVVATEALGRESVALAEHVKKESEWQALEAAIEAQFEAIRSRGTNAHVISVRKKRKNCEPSNRGFPLPPFIRTLSGWFSWTDIHSIEKNTLPSFFNGKTENRTPDVYMEIRNWIMKKFHANPDAQIELKDLSELNVGDLDARQEVMEFLDHWGLINFHPFPSMDSAVASADEDGAAEKNSLLEKLYHFETLQLCPPVVPKTNLTTQAMPSGLFPESTFAEELVKQEGPAVEYHCNSCSADCSRKRYHCQKQADFDLCTECFSNGKFGSGMSSLDFILMEPAEVPGVSGGKWTDQETLLLLEALELYKENWNEIAEHVATKTKAQCILHFVQMPIEDAFVDNGDVDASCKETADPAATNNDSSVLKDGSEAVEHKTSDSIEGQVLPPRDEAPKGEDANKIDVDQETPKPENGSNEKISEGASKPADAAEVELGQEAGDNFALKALGEAFEAVGYSLGPEGASSFAEVGNPVMALAGFLARLVGSDVAVASAHSSLKSISGNSPSIELAARHCFLLEDPPNDKKEPISSERDSKMDEDQDERIEKQDKSMLDGKDLSNDHNDRKIANDRLDDKRQLTSTDGGASEKTIALKEQAIVNQEKVVLDGGNVPSNSKLFNDQAPGIVQDSNGSTSKTETSEKNEIEQSGSSNIEKEVPKSVKTHLEVVSDTVPSDKINPQKPLSKTSVGERMETENPVMNVNMVSNSLPSEKNESLPLGEDHAENGGKIEDDGTKTKQDNKFEKLKRTAVSTLSAAAVKAKLLANQEEDQIQQLTTVLIEKQLHKLETKLAFFNDMDNVMMRVREYLDRSRQKLYHERAVIIASRLGIPPPPPRGVPPSMPTNRPPMNFANSVPRPPISMNPQRPPISRPMGTMATTFSNPLTSATAAGNSIRPSGQDKLSSVGTK